MVGQKVALGVAVAATLTVAVVVTPQTQALAITHVNIVDVAAGRTSARTSASSLLFST